MKSDARHAGFAKPGVIDFDARTGRPAAAERIGTIPLVTPGTVWI